MSNEGLGPAQIRSIVVTVDGIVERSFDGVLSELAPHHRDLRYSGNFANLGPGQVIRVGGAIAIVDVTGSVVSDTVARGFKCVRIRVCHCAIIPGDCRIVERGGAAQGTADPAPVGNCPDARRDMFEAGSTPS